MPSLREARFRHASHYSKVAQQSQTDFDSLALEMANILLAGDFYVDSQDWQNLPQLTQAVNDYLFKRAVWDTYVRLNSALLRNDDSAESYRTGVILKQLAGLEEIRGNYQKARSFYKEMLQRDQYEKIVERYDQPEPKDLDNTLEVLRHVSRLAQIQGDDDEALAYLQRSLTLARHYGMPKEKVDRLLDMASLYRKRIEYDRVHAIYDECLGIAETIGYVTRAVDILILKADLCFLERRLESSMDLSQRALARSLSMGDQIRAANIREQLAKISAAMNRKVFISYNRQDRIFVERLAIDLRAKGLAVWWAEWEIKVGDSIIQKVSDGMLESGYLAVALSPSSVTSDWVQLEVSSALMRQLSVDRDITILPLLLADCEIPVLLRPIRWADFRQDYDAGLKDLLSVLIPNGLSGSSDA